MQVFAKHEPSPTAGIMLFEVEFKLGPELGFENHVLVAIVVSI